MKKRSKLPLQTSQRETPKPSRRNFRKTIMSSSTGKVAPANALAAAKATVNASN
jgi:hypothetical protein